LHIAVNQIKGYIEELTGTDILSSFFQSTTSLMLMLTEQFLPLWRFFSRKHQFVLLGFSRSPSIPCCLW